ncbi:GA-binding protein subunit beta-1 [Diorhabda sublineata]|uniref:GA-binding protein subunit beta-1 n=1 Tax=Diorhabda sublineata TaxID=1163346 RepID=UPI0024E0FE82|nr:GA-binding protein subunit beta-1 [Diorhabda sublineata]
MMKFEGVVENGQNTQRAKYIISTTVPNNNNRVSELIPIHWDGRLISQHSVPVNELGKQLLKAASDGSVEKVKQLLTKGAPFTADWLGTSPLHLSAQNNHFEITEILLRAGISKDARTKVDRTPLHMACYEGHINIVEILLEHGADINCRDLLDMTPLHWAVQNSHIDVVAHLLRNNALIEVTNKFDVTPIMIAQQTGRSDIEQLLVGALNDSTLAAQNLVLQYNANESENENNQIYTDNMELETIGNDVNNFTVFAEPILVEGEYQDIDGETSQEITVEQEEQETDQERIEKENEQLVQHVSVDPAILTSSLKILEEHGIRMLENDENDDGHILNTVMESGHSVVLTDVGKEVLNSVKQNEQKKKSQIVHMDKKIVSVTPEQFLAMTQNSNKTFKQLKVIPTKGTFKRVVMKKNKLIPITPAVEDVMYTLPSTINKENPSKTDMELIMNQLIEARKTIEEYKIKLRKKEQEAQRYKMQLKLLMEPDLP